MYVQGRDFNCKGTSCYGIGPIPHSVFVAVQQSTNAALTFLKVPLKPLVVDGFLGPATVTALVEVGKRVPGRVLATIRSSPTPTTVAQVASEVVAELAAVLPGAGTRPVPSPPAPVPTPMPPVVIPQAPVPSTSVPSVPTVPSPFPTPAMPGATAPVSTGGVPTKYIVAGALVAALSVAIGIGLYARANAQARLQGTDDEYETDEASE